MANTRKLDYVILGLLSHEPLTGYEIKQRIDGTLSMFWGASFGSIYPSLAQLEKNDFVNSSDTSNTGRKKICYSITEKGREELKKWLKEPVEKDELRFETLLKLFFGSENGADGTLEHIERFEEKITHQIPYLEASVKQLESILDLDPAHRYYLLTAKMGLCTYQAFLSWCTQTKDILKSNQEEQL